MIPVSKDKLSKLKYVYKVHQDSKDNIHLEKYPIIYINKYYVYYKANGDQMLNILSTRNIEEKFPDNYDFGRYNSIYFWFSDYKTQEEVNKNFNELKYLALEHQKNQKIQQISKSIKEREDELKQLQKELEMYNNGR